MTKRKTTKFLALSIAFKNICSISVERLFSLIITLICDNKDLLEKNKTCIIPYQKYCVGELKLQTVIFCHEKLDGGPLKKAV